VRQVVTSRRHHHLQNKQQQQQLLLSRPHKPRTAAPVRYQLSAFVFSLFMINFDKDEVMRSDQDSSDVNKTKFLRPGPRPLLTYKTKTKTKTPEVNN